MFDEENFKLAVRLLSKHNLDVNHAEIVADMLEYYSELKINRWLANIASSDDPDRTFDHLLFTVVTKSSDSDQSTVIAPERMRRAYNPRRSSDAFTMNQHSCGVRDESGLEGRYSCTLNFAEIFNDPNIYYGTWEETPAARRRFR